MFSILTVLIILYFFNSTVEHYSQKKNLSIYKCVYSFYYANFISSDSKNFNFYNKTFTDFGYPPPQHRHLMQHLNNNVIRNFNLNYVLNKAY